MLHNIQIVAAVFRSVRNYRRSFFFFLQDPVFSLGCNRTSMKLSGRKKLMKMNVNGVKGIRGHAPLENFESPSSQKNSISCILS